MSFLKASILTAWFIMPLCVIFQGHKRQSVRDIFCRESPSIAIIYIQRKALDLHTCTILVLQYTSAIILLSFPGDVGDTKWQQREKMCIVT